MLRAWRCNTEARKKSHPLPFWIRHKQQKSHKSSFYPNKNRAQPHTKWRHTVALHEYSSDLLCSIIYRYFRRIWTLQLHYALFYRVYTTLLLAQGSFTATGASCFDAVRCDDYIPLNLPSYTNHDVDIFEWRPSGPWPELLFCSNSWPRLPGHSVILCDFSLCFSSSCHPRLCSCTVTDKLPIMFHKRWRISWQEVTII